MIPKLGKVKRINVRDAWMNEASDFTPWLASEEGMELLQEVLDMELEVEATEKYVGPFKADILAKRTDTTDDHWVLIENQLERTDHGHLGQLLTYAAGLEAVTIVWIAANFAEEHRAALDWLNDVTRDDLEFFGLEIELWQIEGSPPAPMFNIVAEPNGWTRDVKQGAGSQVTDLKAQQQRFWQGLRTKLLDSKSPVRPQKAHPQHWADFAIGRAGVWLCATVNSPKKYVSLELQLRGPMAKPWFDQLQAQNQAIEAQIPGLSWQRLDGKKQSKIVLYHENSDPTDESKWPEQQGWLVEQLELFRKVFRPLALDLGDGVQDEEEPEGPEDA
ncbi:MAG: DUF4268 domain-containing protein [Sphingomonadales bacterium]|nr:DUF4268 domain-containing protein [Sphingomonadales bacterium]MDE2570209.1 DUF4268 domain-containing protein [Sphingomonadales bacterium]